jgi:hypothetical protein
VPRFTGRFREGSCPLVLSAIVLVILSLSATVLIASGRPSKRSTPPCSRFPSAKRSADSHSNLVLSEVSWVEGRGLSILVEAYSAAGEQLGSSAAFDLSTGGALFLIDVLARLGVSEFDGGQIRVTKTGGSGLMWGLLATVFDDGRVSVSPGMNP